MKSTKLAIYTLALTTLALSATSCKTSIDAVTSASEKKYHEVAITLPPPSDKYVVHGYKPGIQGFVVQYDDNMYRGGKPTSPEGVKALKDMGIKTIVSVTPTDMEREEAKKHGIKLVEVPLDKESGLSPEELKSYLEAFSAKEHMPVYVHCNSGMHRGGTLGVAYRVHQSDWEWDEAVEEFDDLGGNQDDDTIMLESIKVMHR